MSQDNFWTDELAVEFATWSCNQAPTLQGRYTDVEQFKKSKMPKKEWEILSYIDDKNQVWGWGGVTGSPVNKELQIYQVRRLSDNEVFTVGDYISHIHFGNPGKLAKFYITDKEEMGCMIETPMGTANYFIENWTKYSAPKKERIYVTLVNHYFREQCQNRYAFESTYIIPEEKYPAIKAAIERCLNDEERLSVSILRQAESEAFYAAKRKDYKRPIGSSSHWSSELYHDMYEEFDDYLKSK